VEIEFGIVTNENFRLEMINAVFVSNSISVW